MFFFFHNKPSESGIYGIYFTLIVHLNLNQSLQVLNSHMWPGAIVYWTAQNFIPLLLRVRSKNQQHWHNLGTHWKHKTQASSLTHRIRICNLIDPQVVSYIKVQEVLLYIITLTHFKKYFSRPQRSQNWDLSKDGNSKCWIQGTENKPHQPW